MARVADIYLANPEAAHYPELGAPSTTRRLRAVKRLKNLLSIKYLAAERLLAASTLIHEQGRENFANALALGRYLKYGPQHSDGAAEHRRRLREDLNRLV